MSWAERVIQQLRHKRIDQEVLSALQAIGGCTAYMLGYQVQMDRPAVSRSLQRMKRKGIVKNKGAYWEWNCPSNKP
jgi:predicted transcriptional regulator